MMNEYEILEPTSVQDAADRRLLNFSSYEEYLDSLKKSGDDCFLQSEETAHTIAELGYTSVAEVFNREKFRKRVKRALLLLNPPYKPYKSASEGIRRGDPLTIALAFRERQNRIGNVSTIIFLRYYTKSGFAISGYLDYADRLNSEDWEPFFKGDKKILPRTTDLGYYDWRREKVVSNESSNYHVVHHRVKGLMFLNKHDRILIGTSPDTYPGANTSRHRIRTNLCELAVLIDHVIRVKI